MFPDDRVLIGVINRRRDLNLMLEQRWYRIPQKQMPRGVYAEYIAFYLSGAAAKGQERSGIYYFARQRGVELAYRHQLLPDDAKHERAGEVYYKVQLNEATARIPPIVNASRRRFDFIFTTWDRFLKARELKDLYSTADYFVDRIYHALRDAHIRPERYWETDQRTTGQEPQVRILCERGTVVASTMPGDGVDVLLDGSLAEDEILAQIKARIYSMGGPVTINIPHIR